MSFTSPQGSGSSMSLFAELLAALNVLANHGHPALGAAPSQSAAIVDTQPGYEHRQSLRGYEVNLKNK